MIDKMVGTLKKEQADCSAATLIRGVSVWDGERLLDADGLRLAGGRITHVGRGLRPQPDDRLVDGGGAFALPGLIESLVPATV